MAESSDTKMLKKIVEKNPKPLLGFEGEPQRLGGAARIS